MSFIISSVKDILKTTAQFLNKPIIKEGVKNIAGTTTFVFGAIEIYDIYHIFQGRKISTEINENDKSWSHTASKVTNVCAKISLVFSACTSRPGVFLISKVVSPFSSSLARVFGPNTIFAVNPWHPRHVVSVAAVILAMPSVVVSGYRGLNFVYKKISSEKELLSCRKQEDQYWLTDAKLRLMVLFNTITSRPTLHIGNQFSRLILGR
ncbi:MAG: hypothetical protein H0W88_00315 [Parachlamydiaceae bacterium]|nr:hypothetical protein [Parachlamydiaceae bacterium]